MIKLGRGEALSMARTMEAGEGGNGGREGRGRRALDSEAAE